MRFLADPSRPRGTRLPAALEWAIAEAICRHLFQRLNGMVAFIGLRGVGEGSEQERDAFIARFADLGGVVRPNTRSTVETPRNAPPSSPAAQMDRIVDQETREEGVSFIIGPIHHVGTAEADVEVSWLVSPLAGRSEVHTVSWTATDWTFGEPAMTAIS